MTVAERWRSRGWTESGCLVSGGTAYFPWGFERIPEHLHPLGGFAFADESPELRAWCLETLSNGRHLHDGEPITADELSFQPLAEVFP